MNYTNTDIDSIAKWLKENLTEERYVHSMGTMEAAVELAERFNVDVEKAKVAALLHDCAKCTPEECLKICLENECKYEPCELINDKTWHAPVSAHYAKTEFGVADEEILSAIRWHTIGRIGMTDFEKVIFLADKIEKKTRDDKYRLKILKALNKNNSLDAAMLKCFKLTIKSLLKRKLPICQQTIDVYNELIAKTEK